MTTFISYATEYDMYEGHKDWSELSIKEQDEIIIAELSKTDIDDEELIMSSGLIKEQAQGLRSIFVTISMILERYDLIQNTDDWSIKQRDLIINFLKGTVLSVRLSQAFTIPDNGNRQHIDGNELAEFSGTELDVVLDMDFEEAKEFFLEELENMPYVSSHRDGLKPVSLKTMVQNYRYLPLKLQEINDRLHKIFAGPLGERGFFSTVAETPDFPFIDFDSTVSALRSGNAHLSFGLPSATAFDTIATRKEKMIHMISMMSYWIAAPVALIAGAIISENYWLLLWGILLLPLAFFGTHPHYKKAPIFLIAALIGIFLGLEGESAAVVSVASFFFLAVAGYSFTRRLYNKILISRAFEIEAALMFLLGGNFLHLCGADWSSLWTPSWKKDCAPKIIS